MFVLDCSCCDNHVFLDEPEFRAHCVGNRMSLCSSNVISCHFGFHTTLLSLGRKVYFSTAL